MIEGTAEFDGDGRPNAAAPVTTGGSEPPFERRWSLPRSGEVWVLAFALASLYLLRIGSEHLPSEYLRCYLSDYVWVAARCLIAFLVLDLVTGAVYLTGYGARPVRARVWAARPIHVFGVTLFVSAVIVGVAGPVDTQLAQSVTDSTQGIPFSRSLLDPRLLISVVAVFIWMLAYRSPRRRLPPRQAFIPESDDRDSAASAGIAEVATTQRIYQRQRLFRRVGQMLGWAFGASLALGGGAVARAIPAWVSPVSHRTGALGETYALSDGTVVTLDAYSEFEARISPFHREIHVRGGQALIKVDRNWGQPFRVSGGSEGLAEQVAIGGGGSAVAFALKVVREDAIEVLPLGRNSVGIDYPTPYRKGDGKSWDTMWISGHTVAVIDAAGPRQERITKAEHVARLGWLSGLVVFSNTPLKAALVEINRYSSASRVVLSDGTLAEVPISGTFEEDPSWFAVDLERACIVKIVDNRDEDPYAPMELQRAPPQCTPQTATSSRK